MSVIVLLIIASLGLALVFLAAFIWAVRSGQYDDTCTPSLRVLSDGEPAKPVIHEQSTAKTKSTST